jgi:hypothetical protein
MAIILRVLVILHLAKRVPDLIKQIKAIILAMTGNPFFAAPNPLPNPLPNPPLATLAADLAALESSEALTTAKTKGAASARNTKLATVRTDMSLLHAYVQQIADANESEATAIIESAGMSTRKPTSFTKSVFVAKTGAVSGLVLLVALAVAKAAAYDWQWSTDQKTWTSLPSTLKAKTSVAGLTAGTIYYFRFRALTRKGQGDWGQFVSLLVK